MSTFVTPEAAAAGVAPVGVLPVLVLTKSAPAASARRVAWAMSSGACSSPDSMMTLSVSGRLAKRTSDRNSATSVDWPAMRAR